MPHIFGRTLHSPYISFLSGQFYAILRALTCTPREKDSLSSRLSLLYKFFQLRGWLPPRNGADFSEARGRISPVLSRRDVLTGKKIGATRRIFRSYLQIPPGRQPARLRSRSQFAGTLDADDVFSPYGCPLLTPPCHDPTLSIF